MELIINKIIKVFMVIIALIYFVLFLLGLFQNPLSNKELSNSGYKSVEQSELQDGNFWDEVSEGEFESIKSYLTESNEYIYFIKRQDSDCSEFEIKFEKNGSIECISSLETIKDPNIHPLGFNTTTQSNYHILGTIAVNSGDMGIDRLSNLSEAIFQTALFSFLSLSTFLFFGIYFSLSIGYYDNTSTISRFLSSINQLIMKSFQCVPILLWMLITIIVVGYTENISPLWKTSIYFLFFGLFSSPALSNLIIEKINQMKNEDFIVALKLLGLSDRRIIISHMLRHYCLPIIIFQMAYVMAHAFFLDLTLCYIEKSSSDSATLGWYVYQSYTVGNYGTDTNYLLIISFMLTLVLFYWANYYKKKI